MGKVVSDTQAMPEIYGLSRRGRNTLHWQFWSSQVTHSIPRQELPEALPCWFAPDAVWGTVCHFMVSAPRELPI